MEFCNSNANQEEYICGMCSKIFHMERHLLDHMQGHLDEHNGKPSDERSIVVGNVKGKIPLSAYAPQESISRDTIENGKMAIDSQSGENNMMFTKNPANSEDMTVMLENTNGNGKMIRKDDAKALALTKCIERQGIITNDDHININEEVGTFTYLDEQEMDLKGKHMENIIDKNIVKHSPEHHVYQDNLTRAKVHCKMISHTSDESCTSAVKDKELFQCGACAKVYASIRCLSIHVNKSHNGELPLPFECSFCTRIFPSKYELYKHKRLMHFEMRNCSECGQSFSRLSSLSAHMKQHTQDRHQCPECKMTYRRMSDLVKHRANKHSVRHPYFSCDVCGDIFPESKAVHEHMKIHAVKVHLECGKCGEVFNNRKSYAEHINTHVQMSFCSICHRQFLIRDIESHMKTHRRGEFYKCTNCGLKFILASELLKHIHSRCCTRQSSDLRTYLNIHRNIVYKYHAQSLNE